MLLLIFTLVVGLVIAFFASQNASTVNVILGGAFIPNVPLYLIVLGAMLFGILVSWVISLFNNFSSFLAIRGRENKLRSSDETIAKLEARIKDLETENARLKGENRAPIFRTETVADESLPHRESFVERVRHRIRHDT